MSKKPLEIDACAGSQLRDTQGEMLSVEGADISELEAGKGRFNDNHGKGFFNSIGRVTKAKKIFKEEDCDDDRQRYYWNKIKAPYIYVKGHLYDNEDHPNAKAASAILRNIHKSDVPLKLKASVEGGVISRGISDPSLLARTKIHSVALTFTPANQATLVEPVSVSKSQYDEAADMELMKSMAHLAETNIPSFRHIERDASASRISGNIEKIVALMKDDKDIDIPTKQEILQYALEAKIQSNVARIHEIIDIAKEDTLDKGFKEAAIGAAALAGIAGAKARPQPATVSTAAPATAGVPKEHQQIYQQAAKKNPLLGAIGMVESSGGTNYKHDPINREGTMHHGHTAGGMFGMMPNSAGYILNKDPALAKKYPQLVEAAKDMKNNHHKFTETFNSDPNAAVDFATSLLRRNKTKTKGLEMLISSWNHGLKGTWNKYKTGGAGAVKSSDYVKKVMEAYDKLKPKHSKKVAKALMAGYGGGGAPTSMTGGNVIQAESLDVGNGKGFKYVTCDNCGKEQIYSKFQVKCRDCGNSWSLKKIHGVMVGSKG